MPEMDRHTMKILDCELTAKPQLSNYFPIISRKNSKFRNETNNERNLYLLFAKYAQIFVRRLIQIPHSKPGTPFTYLAEN